MRDAVNEFLELVRLRDYYDSENEFLKSAGSPEGDSGARYRIAISEGISGIDAFTADQRWTDIAFDGSSSEKAEFSKEERQAAFGLCLISMASGIRTRVDFEKLRAGYRSKISEAASGASVELEARMRSLKKE